MKAKYKGGKKSVTDVIVMINDGTIVNIESQIKKQEKFHKRSHFYNSKIRSLYLNAGQDHEELPMTIMISILDFNLHKVKDYSTFILCDKRNKPYVMEDILETHYLELPTFRQHVKNDTLSLNDPKDRLMLVLDKKTPQKLFEKVIEMDELSNKLYKKSLHVLQDQSEYLAYIRAEQAEQDQNGMLRYAKNKGRKEGENDKAIEIAINLKKLGLAAEQITKVTGVAITKIKKL